MDLRISNWHKSNFDRVCHHNEKLKKENEKLVKENIQLKEEIERLTRPWFSTHL